MTTQRPHIAHVLAFVAALLGVLAGPLAAPASAHTANTYFHAIWETETKVEERTLTGVVLVPQQEITEFYTSGSNWYTGRRNLNEWSAERWDNPDTKQYFNIEYQGHDNSISSNCTDNSYNESSSHWVYIDGDWPQSDDLNTVAQAQWCVFSGNNDRMHNVQVKYDTGDRWSFHSVRTDSYDFRSIAAHEWGHAVGHGHYAHGGKWCPGSVDASWQTMCSTSATDDTSSSGWDALRSLEAHDIHTFKDAYDRNYNRSW